MKTSEMVFNYLMSQGFAPQKSDDGTIFFKYQMSSFIYPNNDSDNEYFQILYPAIYEVTPANRQQVLNAINEMNRNLKVGKTFILNNDSVWMSFEILLDRTPDVSDIFPRALRILTGGRQQFYDKVRNL